MKSKTKTDGGRRGFLKGVALAGGAATVAVAAGRAVAASTDAGAEKQPASGYRLTKHVKDYYDTTRM